jgi:hypothetical protein
VAAAAWLVLAVLAVSLFSGCTQNSVCRYGDEDSAAVLEDFLANGAAGDQAGAAELLSEGWSLDEGAFAVLNAVGWC